MDSAEFRALNAVANGRLSAKYRRALPYHSIVGGGYAGMARVVARMQRAGMIELARAPEPLALIPLRLTEKGREALERFRATAGAG